MHDPVQIVFLLDLASDNPVPEAEVLARIPDKRDRRVVLRLSEFGAQPAARGAITDWSGTADAVARMVAKARAEPLMAGQIAHFYVAGRAALPVFAHLGLELAPLANVTVLNQRPGGAWDVLPLQGEAPGGGPAFFKVVRGVHPNEPSDAGGRVCVIISTGQPVDKAVARAFVAEHGGTVGGTVELLTGGETPSYLDETNAASVAQQLVDVVVQIRGTYPYLTGIALFIAGPASLALMAGRAVNPHILLDVWVPNFDGRTYQFAAALPWKGAVRPGISHSPEVELARTKALAAMLAKIEQLRTTLKPEDLPPFLTDADKTRLLERLRVIDIARDPVGDAFDLSVSERTMTFGRGLLDALLSVTETDRARIAQSIVLHELFHFDQGIQSTTYIGVGRAGFALEEVDYWADAVALGTLVSWEIRRGGEEARDRAREILLAHIDAALNGVAAFDHLEHGDRIERLYERRLRRYLIWHLQRARAATLTRGEDVWELCGKRLIVELAPLEGHLDDRFDKVVKGPQANVEVFVVLQGRLCRTPRRGGFDPGALVESVRAFDRDALRAAMRTICDYHLQVLAPWVR